MGQDEMASGALSTFSEWWQVPGTSEFVSAVVGAVVGSLSGGLISKHLQQAAFEAERKNREAHKLEADRALILQTLYACVQAVSDLHKFNEEAEAAKQRAPTHEAPNIAGLSNTWTALYPLATLPEPISINPEALTVLFDHKDADLAMDVLNVVAVHRSAIKLWDAFGQSRRRFGEKVSVKRDGDVTYTPISQEEMERLYPHLKELTDMADGIIAGTADQHELTKDVVLRVREFLERNMDTKLGISFPENA